MEIKEKASLVQNDPFQIKKNYKAEVQIYVKVCSQNASKKKTKSKTDYMSKEIEMKGFNLDFFNMFILNYDQYL